MDPCQDIHARHAEVLTYGLRLNQSPSRVHASSGSESSSGSSDHKHDQGLEDYVECKVDNVTVSSNPGGTSIVYLRLLGQGDSHNMVLPVHIALTHDVAKNMLSTIGFRVTKIRITDIVSNTYYARIHLAPMSKQGGGPVEEVDVDARPSDAINLAVRFGVSVGRPTLPRSPGGISRLQETQGLDTSTWHHTGLTDSFSRGAQEFDQTDTAWWAGALSVLQPTADVLLGCAAQAPMYVRKTIAEMAAIQGQEMQSAPRSTETHNDIARSVKATLSSFEDPCIMLQLQKDLAVQEQRYEDAHKLQQSIYHEMTHSTLLRLVVAMEAALQDGRFEEAARLRDEFRRIAHVSMPSERQAR
ncbi:hypothetical protein QJQ45_026912 [Haematococcus lacustris]|nr:hypothetical protein QJQ45_026912 [Haematococcus lacustris]